MTLGVLLTSAGHIWWAAERMLEFLCNTADTWVSEFFSMCGDLTCPISSLYSPSPPLSFCTLDMQDGKRPVKSGAVCMCWPASKMSSTMLNSWVVPIWPQVWVLLFFSLGNLINSEIKDQLSTLYNFVKICKCIHNLVWAERRDSRQIGCIQIITGKPFCPKQVTKAPHYPKLPILVCFQ